MVEMGLVKEAEEFFDDGGDYSGGIRRAIGVPELDEYFRGGGGGAVLEAAIDEIKANTRNLAGRQLRKIVRLAEHLMRRMHRLEATEAFLRRGGEAWERAVLGPSTRIVGSFLCEDFVSVIHAPPPATAAASVILGPASAAATR